MAKFDSLQANGISKAIRDRALGKLLGIKRVCSSLRIRVEPLGDPNLRTETGTEARYSGRTVWVET